MRRAARLVILLLSLLAGAPASRAEDQPFFKGKQLRLLLSTGVAGSYSQYGRALARHFGNHLAGKPDMIVESMPGGGGLIAANYLYFSAPKDGTTLGLVYSTVPLAPLFGIPQARFEALKFNWLGSIAAADGVCAAWHDAPIKSWSDMLTKEFIVGGAGPANSTAIYPAVLNKLFGTKIKVVNGYNNGDAIFLAMERGEVQGRCGPLLNAVRTTRPDWLPQHKIVLPIVIDEARYPEFPDTPAILEFTKDDKTRAQLRLMMLMQHMDHPMMLPPEVPAERVAALRVAFDATMTDPGFLEDAAKLRIPISPVDGKGLAQALAEAYALPADVVAAAKESIGAMGD